MRPSFTPFAQVIVDGDVGDLVSIVGAAVGMVDVAAADIRGEGVLSARLKLGDVGPVLNLLHLFHMLYVF